MDLHLNVKQYNKISPPISIELTQIHCKFKDFHSEKVPPNGLVKIYYNYHKNKLFSGSSFKNRGKNKYNIVCQFRLCLHKFIANAKIFMKKEYYCICLSQSQKTIIRRNLKLVAQLNVKRKHKIISPI